MSQSNQGLSLTLVVSIFHCWPLCETSCISQSRLFYLQNGKVCKKIHIKKSVQNKKLSLTHFCVSADALYFKCVNKMYENMETHAKTTRRPREPGWKNQKPP